MTVCDSEGPTGVLVAVTGTCGWCAEPFDRTTLQHVDEEQRSPVLYCSPGHKHRAKAKRAQIASKECPTPAKETFLSLAVADASKQAGSRAYHCLCSGWHLTTQAEGARPVSSLNPPARECPTPNKVSYGNTSEAHQAQPRAKNGGMRCYPCRCGSWHWGHVVKERTTIGRALSHGNQLAWNRKRRR